MPRRPLWYILNDDRTVSPVEPKEWAAWMSISIADLKARVAFTDIGRNGSGVQVSTIFLGIDHSFGSGPPILFETMVFGGKYDHEMWRCSTFAEALVQHEKACQVVKGEIAMFKRRLR